jgi:hypothetical protein
MRYYAATAAPFNEVRPRAEESRERKGVALFGPPPLSPVAETNPANLMRLVRQLPMTIVLPRLYDLVHTPSLPSEGQVLLIVCPLARSRYRSRFASLTRLQALRPRRNGLRKFSFLYDSREYREYRILPRFLE